MGVGNSRLIEVTIVDERPDHKIVARWQAWEEAGLEHLVLQEGPQGIVAEASIIGQSSNNGASNNGAADETPFAMTYRIACDPDWRVRTVEARLVGMACSIHIASDGMGTWTTAGGSPLPALDGAIDVDIMATPFTNTLPIRRLDLAEGQSADIQVAYVSVPDLTLSLARQRYTCLTAGALYRFDALESGFTRDIGIDQDGLVTEYPGLFRRIIGP
jgi:hypothetical protein